VRTCAGCRRGEPTAQADLLRLAFVPEHVPPLVPDLAGKLGGRGVWLHASVQCLEQAARRGGFSRSLRRPVRVDRAALAEALRDQLRARARGLLSSALRKRAAALGTDAVRDALTTGAARLLVVANDAAGRRHELCALAERLGCPVCELSDKASLGQLAGRESLGILAISEASIAKEIGSCARQLAGLAEGE